MKFAYAHFPIQANLIDKYRYFNIFSSKKYVLVVRALKLKTSWERKTLEKLKLWKESQSIELKKLRMS